MQMLPSIQELKIECEKLNYRINEEERIIFIPYTDQFKDEVEIIKLLSRKYFFNIQTEIV